MGGLAGGARRRRRIGRRDVSSGRRDYGSGLRPRQLRQLRATSRGLRAASRRALDNVRRGSGNFRRASGNVRKAWVVVLRGSGVVRGASVVVQRGDVRSSYDELRARRREERPGSVREGAGRDACAEGVSVGVEEGQLARRSGNWRPRSFERAQSIRVVPGRPTLLEPLAAPVNTSSQCIFEPIVHARPDRITGIEATPLVSRTLVLARAVAVALAVVTACAPSVGSGDWSP